MATKERLQALLDQIIGLIKEERKLKMKRICSLCLDEYRYTKVKKYRHRLQLCVHCQDVILELSSTTESILRR